jgi:hypothetical protein
MTDGPTPCQLKLGHAHFAETAYAAVSALLWARALERLPGEEIGPRRRGRRP